MKFIYYDLILKPFKDHFTHLTYLYQEKFFMKEFFDFE